MPKEDQGKLTDLEKQVDGLISQINDVLKLDGGDDAEVDKRSQHAGMTGSGKHNFPGWKRPSKNHTHQIGSPVRHMVGKALAEEADDEELEKRLDAAAEALGMEKSELLDLFASKAKGKPFGNDGNDGNDGDGSDGSDDDEDDTGSTPGNTKKLAPEDDESVVIEGERIHKSEVGDAVYNVLKAQSDKIEKQRLDIQQAQDEAEMEKMKKRADDLFSHVPGTTDERAYMLKAMSGMPDKLRKSFEQVMQQSEKLAKSAFTSIGSRAGDPEAMQKSKRDFETKVAEIAKRDSISRTEAMAKARQEDPEAFKAFQGNGH